MTETGQHGSFSSKTMTMTDKVVDDNDLFQLLFDHAIVAQLLG